MTTTVERLSTVTVPGFVEPFLHYELNKAKIIKVFNENGRRVQATERALKALGLSVSRPHLTKNLKKWGVIN